MGCRVWVYDLGLNSESLKILKGWMDSLALVMLFFRALHVNGSFGKHVEAVTLLYHLVLWMAYTEI